MADFTVAMVDYDYASLEHFEREVVKLGGRFIEKPTTNPKDAIEFAGEADGWIVQYLNPVDAAIFKACPNLKAVGRCGIGVDVVNLTDATDHGVVVTNVPGYCVDEVSDHAMALALSCLRGTALYTPSVMGGTWDWKIGAPIPRLRGLTMGLVGYGSIPRTLVPKAKAFGFDILCYDPYLKAEVAEADGVKQVELDVLLSQSDVVSIHCPLVDETRNMFNADAFAKMKPSAILVNTARGEIVEAPALVDALKTGKIRAAGIDVMPNEPPCAEDWDAIKGLDNLVITPHVAWYSEDSIVELQQRVARNVALVCLGKMPDSVVNRDVLEKVTLTEA
jgi:D-3-phosphoglycerate dehydrogenase / 2-oxoglutarate reductase